MMDVTEPTSDDGRELGYADALAELDRILAGLEGSDVDVDHLAEQVERASTLIALCRDRITAAQVRVEQVTADLEPT